jgi:hypothetical protein
MDDLREQLVLGCCQLSAARRAAVPGLVDLVQSALGELAMGDARFDVQITWAKEPEVCEVGYVVSRGELPSCPTALIPCSKRRPHRQTRVCHTYALLHRQTQLCHTYALLHRQTRVCHTYALLHRPLRLEIQRLSTSVQMPLPMLGHRTGWAPTGSLTKAWILW